MSPHDGNGALLFMDTKQSSLPKLTSLPFSSSSKTNHQLEPAQLPPLSPHLHKLPPLRLPTSNEPASNASSTYDYPSQSHDSLIQRLRDFTTTSHAQPSPTVGHSRNPPLFPPLQLPPLSPITPAPRSAEIHSPDNMHPALDRPHACRKCSATFRRRDNLMAHFRAQHKGERPFRCEACGFRFIKKDHAMKHWKVVHLKERPFVCNQCDSRFGQRSDLNKHVRSVHLRIKPFQCDSCGLRFSHRGNQIRHQAVVHDKKKPFACSFCTFTFAEKSNLLKHCQAVHKTAAQNLTMRDSSNRFPMGLLPTARNHPGML